MRVSSYFPHKYTRSEGGNADPGTQAVPWALRDIEFSFSRKCICPMDGADLDTGQDAPCRVTPFL